MTTAGAAGGELVGGGTGTDVLVLLLVDGLRVWLGAGAPVVRLACDVDDDGCGLGCADALGGTPC